MTKQLRVIFMGTPDYAVPSLRALHAHPKVDLALVVTQPDRPQGRGRKLQSPPVRLVADELGVSVQQVATLRDPETRAKLQEISPDLIVVAAFGIILGSKTLDLPRLGCVNLHASVLPSYRGANPIAAAIAMGEQETGVTLMLMDRGLDTGPILNIRSIPIEPADTTASLTVRLAEVAAALLSDSIDALADGYLRPEQQPDGATLTRPMVKDDGWIKWTSGAAVVSNHVRAMFPWPRAWTTLPDGTRLQVLAVTDRSDIGVPGMLSISGQDAIVGCTVGAIRLDEVQLPGGRPLSGRALVEKLRRFDGEQLGDSGKPEHLKPMVVPA